MFYSSVKFLHQYLRWRIGPTEPIMRIGLRQQVITPHFYQSFPTVTPPLACLPQGYTELNEANRHWSYDDGANLACDRDLIISDQWYRFTGAAGVMMASHCIPQKSCNTHMAGWINGAHPTELYETVSATACFHWNSDCCYVSYSVRIRKCSGFYVYKLQAPGGCYKRYCGVNGEFNQTPPAG